MSGVNVRAYGFGNFDKNNAKAHCESNDGQYVFQMNPRARHTCVSVHHIEEVVRQVRLQSTLDLAELRDATIVHELQKNISESRNGRQLADHQFAELERMAIVQRQCTGGCSADVSTEKHAQQTSIVLRDDTHKTNGDLIFSARRVRLMLFHA